MDETRTTRRDWLKLGLGAGLPLAGCAGAPEGSPRRKLKVVAVGGHVDDPQAGCGGTMALYANLGADGAAMFLTPGDSEWIAKGVRIPEKELARKRSAR